MAGLIDELIGTLTDELKIYEKLIPVSEEKSRVVIENDLQRLMEITSIEQDSIGRLKALEKRRDDIMNNIKLVLNKKNQNLTIEDLIDMSEKQPEQQKVLAELRKDLKKSLDRIKTLNAQNNRLISESLEIANFEMNMIRSSRSFIGNNYTRKAGGYEMSSMSMGSFDARQ